MFTQRTYCGEVNDSQAGARVQLGGWVDKMRDLGGIIFIELRDVSGIVQVVVDSSKNPDVASVADSVRNEFCLRVEGTVRRRSAETVNPALKTGTLEVEADIIEVLNPSLTPPFPLDTRNSINEELRLQYRYLDLRREEMRETILARHRATQVIRSFLTDNRFIEIETPILNKSTPEGARDFLVPSRINRGMFYALPQSPQLFKQILMVAGFDRYYQVARCFRDEDLRADRQPEFTQIDLEMSFTGEEGVMEIFEEMMKGLFRTVLGKEISTPIPRMEYAEAMDRFGIDRPDMRFGMELKNISNIAAESEFNLFRQAVENGGCVKAIKVEKAAAVFSRKILDELSRFVADLGAKGLVWIKVMDNEWQSPIAKFFHQENVYALNKAMDARPGDLLLIVSDKTKVVNQALGMLRLEVAKRLGIIDKDAHSFLWVTRFPLLEYDENEGRLQAVHHPFTAPLTEDLHLLKDSPEKVRARAYDLVLNGVEIGGGSVRIHDMSLQDEMFKILGISREAADRKFGFFLEALKYGAPPHAGMAIGLDRLVAIIVGAESLREVIAFPKTSSASCLMSDAPSIVEDSQLKELGIGLLSE